jgi:hypothetical protein
VLCRAVGAHSALNLSDTVQCQFPHSTHIRLAIRWARESALGPRSSDSTGRPDSRRMLAHRGPLFIRARGCTLAVRSLLQLLFGMPDASRRWGSSARAVGASTQLLSGVRLEVSTLGIPPAAEPSSSSSSAAAAPSGRLETILLVESTLCPEWRTSVEEPPPAAAPGGTWICVHHSSGI